MFWRAGSEAALNSFTSSSRRRAPGGKWGRAAPAVHHRHAARKGGPDVLVHDNGGSLVGHDCGWGCCAPRVSMSMLLRSFWWRGRGNSEGDGIVAADEKAVDEGVHQRSRAVMRSVTLAPAERQAPDECCGVGNVAWPAGSSQRHAMPSTLSCIKPQKVDLFFSSYM